MDNQHFIFISYRRSDSISEAGRIYDSLSAHFGRDRVFKDVFDIPYGVDFVEHLDRAVSHCQILVAIIGQTWVNVTAADGTRRLDDPEDFVRIEVASALKRNILVIPVLVNGATMPSSNQLPADLKPLARRNAAIVRHDPDYHDDMNRLIGIVRDYFNRLADVAEQPAEAIGQTTGQTAKLEAGTQLQPLASSPAGVAASGAAASRPAASGPAVSGHDTPEKAVPTKVVILAALCAANGLLVLMDAILFDYDYNALLFEEPLYYYAIILMPGIGLLITGLAASLGLYRLKRWGWIIALLFQLLILMFVGGIRLLDYVGYAYAGGPVEPGYDYEMVAPGLAIIIAAISVFVLTALWRPSLRRWFVELG